MRHREGSNQESVGPLGRFARGIGLLLLAPIAFVVGILLLPFALIARLLGFKPGKHFARHRSGGGGRGCRRRGEPGQEAGDAPTTAQA